MTCGHFHSLPARASTRFRARQDATWIKTGSEKGFCAGGGEGQQGAYMQNLKPKKSELLKSSRVPNAVGTEIRKWMADRVIRCHKPATVLCTSLLARYPSQPRALSNQLAGHLFVQYPFIHTYGRFMTNSFSDACHWLSMHNKCISSRALPPMKHGELGQQGRKQGTERAKAP